MKPIKVTVSREVYANIGNRFTWSLPLKHQYADWIPPQAFSIGEDDLLLAEKPDEIIFRRRWSRRKATRKIRMAVLVHDELDGRDDFYIKLYLV